MMFTNRKEDLEKWFVLHKMDMVGKMSHFALTGSIGFDLYADNYYAKTFVPPFDIKDGYEIL